MQPRPYQTELIADTRALIRELSATVQGRKPRIVMRSACGSGKTATAGFIAKACVDKGGTVVFAAHRDFLVDQTSKTFKRLGINHSFLAAGKLFNPWVPAHIGMIQSMKSRMKKLRKEPTICIIDEASHIVAKTWRAVLEAWPNTIFILLTATPSFRTDGRGLEELADGMVFGPPEAKLIETGDLSDFVWYAPSKPDLSQVHTRMGEYVTAEVDAEMSKAVIVGNIVASYRKYADNTRAIYFASSIETSKRYAEAFNAAGIPAAHLDADSSEWERKRVAEKMASGELMIMTNVGIASYGYDLAAQAGRDVTIETVGLCRPTKSFPLLVQMAMRAMRAKPYPGIILDHAACWDEHQWLPSDDVEWSLSGEAKRERNTDIYCQGCGAKVPATTIVCKHCGCAQDKEKCRESAPRAAIEHVDGDLVALQKDAERREKKRQQGAARTLPELIEFAKAQGYKNPTGWSAHIWSARQARRA